MDFFFFQVFMEYFKEMEEESIRDNFVIIYELMDELMDFGYPQFTESKILQEYVWWICWCCQACDGSIIVKIHFKMELLPTINQQLPHNLHFERTEQTFLVNCLTKYVNFLK